MASNPSIDICALLKDDYITGRRNMSGPLGVVEFNFKEYEGLKDPGFLIVHDLEEPQIIDIMKRRPPADYVLETEKNLENLLEDSRKGSLLYVIGNSLLGDKIFTGEIMVDGKRKYVFYADYSNEMPYFFMHQFK